MEIFTKNKVFKLFISALLITLITVPTNIFASTNSNVQAIVDPTTAKFISIFPSFKASLDKYTDGNLITQSEIYYKYTPKSTASTEKIYNNEADINKDFEIKKYTKQQYANERLGIGTNIIGGQEGGNSSWLLILLDVYNSSGLSNYMVYNFGSWITQPIYHMSDAIGISVGDTMMVSSDSGTRFSSYNHTNMWDEDINETASVQISAGGKGVMSVFTLSPAGPGINEYHNFMVSTGVKYNNALEYNGWITGNYLHTQASIGSISMSVKGVPGVSASIDNDLLQGSRPVSR